MYWWIKTTLFYRQFFYPPKIKISSFYNINRRDARLVRPKGSYIGTHIINTLIIIRLEEGHLTVRPYGLTMKLCRSWQIQLMYVYIHYMDADTIVRVRSRIRMCKPSRPFMRADTYVREGRHVRMCKKQRIRCPSKTQ